MTPAERKKYAKEWRGKKMTVRLDRALFMRFKMVCLANDLNPTKVLENVTAEWTKVNAIDAKKVLQAIS